MPEVTLSGLRVCREVAALGSISAAARSLGYSQPAVSRQVAAVEVAVGHSLFERHRGGIRATASGAVILEHAARILTGVEAMNRDIEALGDGLAGHLALGAFPAAAAALVPRAVAALQRDHPGLDVSLTEASTPTLLRDLRLGRLQVAVIGVGAGLTTYDLDGLHRHRLAAGDLCVALPAGHRLAAAESVPVAELATEAWIVGAGAAGDPQFQAWPTLADPVVRFRVQGWPARLGLVAAGLGVCVVPEMVVPALPAGVVAVAVDDPQWLGRSTLALTAQPDAASTAAVVDALQHAARAVSQKG